CTASSIVRTANGRRGATARPPSCRAGRRARRRLQWGLAWGPCMGTLRLRRLCWRLRALSLAVQAAHACRRELSMTDLAVLINLVAPFFGLIALGFFCGKRVPIPEGGLAWMQFFLIYVALPPLFYRLIINTPTGELANWPFI